MGVGGDARIAGSAEEAPDPTAPPESAHESVLATPTAHHQNIKRHGSLPLRTAYRLTRRRRPPVRPATTHRQAHQTRSTRMVSRRCGPTEIKAIRTLA